MTLPPLPSTLIRSIAASISSLFWTVLYIAVCPILLKPISEGNPFGRRYYLELLSSPER